MRGEREGGGARGRGGEGGGREWRNGGRGEGGGPKNCNLAP